MIHKAYRKMDVTRERLSRVLALSEIFLSFQTGFNLVKAAVVCAILKSISGWYSKLVTVSSFCPFTLISSSPLSPRCHQISKVETGDCSASSADSAFVIF